MPELSTVSPASVEEQADASSAGGVRPRQGKGSKTYANFSSAITSLLAYRRSSLLAILAILIGAMLVMAMAILIQGANTPFATRLYARVMTILLISIGGGVFVASGLILMNIQLAVGMERSREFSIRLVVGARRCDIRNQILFEALLLSLIGGASGSGWGLLIGFLFTLLLQLPFVINPLVIVFLVSASVVPGIACGFYPALKIAHQDFERMLRAD